MRKAIAVGHFGTQSALARALGIGHAAVSKWGEWVPPLQAARLAQLTGNVLKFDPSQYADWYTRKRLSK